MREDTVPHEGQEAVGDVVRRVRMISSATSTPSTWTLERSGKMIIGCLLVLEKVGKSEKMFNLLLYHRADQQGCVTINLRSFRQFDVRELLGRIWLQPAMEHCRHRSPCEIRRSCTSRAAATGLALPSVPI